MNPRHALLEMHPVYGICHYLIGFIYDGFFRGEVVGRENLPEKGPFIIASNHASHLDPPAVGSQVPRQLRFFARKTLWKPGFPSWWLDTVGTIPVDRDGGSDVQAIKRVLGALKEGAGLIMFPEGTRSPDGTLQPAKAGVGMIACRAAVPVVPARIFDSHLAYGKGRGVQLGVSLPVVFGKPLPPSSYDPGPACKERYQTASERIMAAIARLPRPRSPVI